MVFISCQILLWWLMEDSGNPTAWSLLTRAAGGLIVSSTWACCCSFINSNTKWCFKNACRTMQPFEGKKHEECVRKPPTRINAYSVTHTHMHCTQLNPNILLVWGFGGCRCYFSTLFTFCLIKRVPSDGMITRRQEVITNGRPFCRRAQNRFSERVPRLCPFTTARKIFVCKHVFWVCLQAAPPSGNKLLIMMMLFCLWEINWSAHH